MNQTAIKQPLIYTALFLLTLSSCINKSEPVPFPAQEMAFPSPSVKPLKFSKPQKINWDSRHPEDAKPAVVRKINFDKLPSKPFYPVGFRPLEKPVEESGFNISRLPDTLFHLDSFPSRPLKMKTSLIEPPQVIKAGLPKLKMYATMGIFEFGEDQGLPASFVNTLMQDSQGMMWIATEKGLCRFNGEYLEIYSFIEPIFTGSLASVSKLVEDKQGRIWVKTDLNGIYVFDRKAGIVNHLALPFGGFELNNDYEMIIDSEGLIWIGSVTRGIYVVDSQEKTIRRITFLQSADRGNAKQILEDNEGNIWVGSLNGLSIIDRKSEKVHFLNRLGGLKSDTITSLFMDSEKKIWVGTTGNGFDIINTKNGTIQHAGKAQGIKNIVNHFAEDNNRKVWMASDSGVYIFETTAQQIKLIDVSKGLSDNKIKTIYNDDRGQIWIATYKGLDLINAKGLMPDYLTEIDGLSSPDVWSFLQDSLKRIWIGSLQGIDLYYPDQEKIKSVAKELQLKKGRTISYSFRQYQNGKLLISAPGFAIAIVDPVKETISYITKEQGQRNTFPSSFMVDNIGRIWTGSFQNGGIEIIDVEKNTYTLINKKSGLTGSIVWELMQDNKGQIWAATDSGINIINPEEKTIKYLTGDEGISELNGGAFLSDDKGRVWFGTRTGLFIADEEKGQLTAINTENGLSAPDVYTLFKNKKNIYAGTGNGLTVFSPREDISSADKNQFDWHIQPYGKEQGLIYTNFNAGSAFSLNDKFWWGILDKALTITDEPRLDSSVTVTYISGIIISDKLQNFTGNKSVKQNVPESDTIWTVKKDTFSISGKLSPDTGWLEKNNITWDSLTGNFNLPVNLILPADQNYISFQFTGSQLSNRDKTRYRYILEGFDETWRPVTDKPVSENYRDLPAGKYNFKVCSKGINGLWSQPAEFSFTVLPPWWNTWWAWLLYVLAFSTIVWIIVQYRSRMLKKENRILEEKVSHRTAQLKKSLEDLKATQSQLIQSEKMASLGELTAGIAHEIQNPLNFVNNFSELSNELIDEMKEEVDKGNYTDVKSIAEDIKQNLEKINYHGKRADTIVRGMLQHSRSSTGEKEPTDINALADEYLRLAYHGLRAKDKDFNVSMQTDFDQAIGKIPLIPQDIGRVLLNLYNNAFYAVSNKALENKSAGFEPTIKVSTKSAGNKLEIRVIDNGMGIPEKVREKIFQPFFTTKPTGQGTGLGLSLSYDIIKAHGGEFKVETKEGEGSEFVVSLPI